MSVFLLVLLSASIEIFSVSCIRGLLRTILQDIRIYYKTNKTFLYESFSTQADLCHILQFYHKQFNENQISYTNLYHYLLYSGQKLSVLFRFPPCIGKVVPPCTQKGRSGPRRPSMSMARSIYWIKAGTARQAATLQQPLNNH